MKLKHVLWITLYLFFIQSGFAENGKLKREGNQWVIRYADETRDDQVLHLTGMGKYDEVTNRYYLPNVSGQDKYINIENSVKTVAEHSVNLLRIWCQCPYYSPYGVSPNISPFRQNDDGKFIVSGFNLNFEDKCDEEWRNRLRALIDKAKNPDGNDATDDTVFIVLTFWEKYEMDWRNDSEGRPFAASPWNGWNNNITNGIKLPANENGFPEFYTNPATLAAEENFVKQIVDFTKNDYNVIYEIMNEPKVLDYNGSPPVFPGAESYDDPWVGLIVEWHKRVSEWIREKEDQVNSCRHLIAVVDGDAFKEGEFNLADHSKAHIIDLYNDENEPCFDVFSDHSVSKGWDNYQVDCNGYDPCGEVEPGNEYYKGLNLVAQANTCSNFLSSHPGKLLICDDDGLHRSEKMGSTGPYYDCYDTAPDGSSDFASYSRDYDYNRWCWSNISFANGCAYNHKGEIYYLVNTGENDCQYWDDWWDYYYENGDLENFQGVDGPYLNLVNAMKNSPCYIKPYVRYAGFLDSPIQPGTELTFMAIISTVMGDPAGADPVVRLEIDGVSYSLSSYLDGSGHRVKNTYTTTIENPPCDSDEHNLELFVNGQSCWPNYDILPIPDYDLSGYMTSQPTITAAEFFHPDNGYLSQETIRPVLLDESLWPILINAININPDTDNYHCPEIQFAGYDYSRMVQYAGGSFSIMAYVTDPDNDIDTVKMKIEYPGVDYETPLIRNPSQTQIFSLSFPMPPYFYISDPDQLKITLIAEDAQGNKSGTWPKLKINNPDAPNDLGAPGVGSIMPILSAPPHASGIHFYTNALEIRWPTATTVLGNQIPAKYNIYAGPKNDMNLNLIASNVTGNSYLIDQLDDCTAYDFAIEPFNTCATGSQRRSRAYTGYPEVPYNITATGANGQFTIQWEIRNTWKSWEYYEIYSTDSSGQWFPVDIATEPQWRTEISPGHFKLYKIRICNLGVTGCFSDAVFIFNDATTIQNNEVIFMKANDDEFLDALVNDGAGGCSLFYQNADKSYSNANFHLDIPVQNIKATDINGDLAPDLLCIDSSKISILVNDSGRYSQVDNILIAENSKNIASVDLDKDGKKELVVVKDENIIVAKDDIVEGYKVDQTLESTDNIMIATGDLNDDTSIDLVTSTNSGDVTIFVNSGTGAMSQWATLTVSAGITGLELTDFDLDWDLDLVITDANDHESRYINDGNAAFTLN